MLLIRFPLSHHQLFFADIRPFDGFQSHIIETLQSAHRGGAHRKDLSFLVNQILDETSAHTKRLDMHLMILDGVRFDRFEGTRTYVQGQFVAHHPFVMQRFKHPLRKMQSGSRGCHRTFYLRVNRLIGLFILLLRVAIQIRRDRKFARFIQHFSKREFAIPFKFHQIISSYLLFLSCCQTESSRS